MIQRLLILTALAATIAPAAAESLWQNESAGLFADHKARKVGDLVTIAVVEATSSSLSASSDFDKSLDHSNKAGVGPLLKLLPEFEVSSSQSGSAGGKTTMTNKLISTLTATVIEVLPSGALKVCAQRTITTNGEKQEMSLTGTVRCEDIDPSNTVQSTLLSNVSITYTGKGPVGDRQKEGIISRLVRFLF